ncbi:MAG: IS91 family transposase [Deltaproteobacteria bacterium]|nr:IS91 family transposase [Deltaproteobacteria bacterium]
MRRHRAALAAQQRLSVAQRRVLSAIGLCRTAALGGHIDLCRRCELLWPAFNSCRNRHCPKCQALAQERWIAARAARLLPVPHFHVVFTLPSELRSLARYRPAEIYGALFAAASETLLELGTTRLKARLAVTLVLHTWSRELRLHPHVHAIVTAGGLATDGSRWNACSDKYLMPVRMMGALLRGKMMAALRTLQRAGSFDGFEALADPEGFERLMSRLAATSWLVYAKRPLREVSHVLAYLGRYTHRVAIANSRLLDVTDRSVTFRTRHHDTATLSPVEFLRRFVQHVLPDGLRKIRHYGLYSATAARPAGALALARSLLPALPASGSTDGQRRSVAASWQQRLRELTGRDVRLCPKCLGPLLHVRLRSSLPRAPPHRWAA